MICELGIRYDLGRKISMKYDLAQKNKYEVWFDLKTLITMFVKYDVKNLSMKYDFAK